MPQTVRLGLPFTVASQAQKEVTHNESLELLDALVQAAAVTVGDDTPPGSPAAGDCYVVGDTPTGAWVGQAQKLAYYTTGWNFIAPWPGLTVWVATPGTLYTYDGSAWGESVATVSFQNLPMVGVNTTADSTNKLAVASEAILFNHIGNSLQVKLNKNATGNSAGFLFQSNWSARAEFGLLGDDNFTLKVSPDGSTFYDSLKMLADSGRMALKRNAAGLSGAGTTQGDATAIVAQTNQFTTVGANQGARLPWPEQGDFIFVANAGANALRVYPHYGHYINALAADAFFSLPAGRNTLFWAGTGDRWYALLSA